MIELTKDLLTKKAEEVAKENLNQRDKKATSTQIRKFYDDFLLLHMKCHTKDFNDSRFEKEILPMIFFSKAKLAYAVGRKVLDIKFKDSIEQELDKIDCIKAFDNFILFYQAIIGYSKFLGIGEEKKGGNSYPNKTSLKKSNDYNNWRKK